MAQVLRAVCSRHSRRRCRNSSSGSRYCRGRLLCSNASRSQHTVRLAVGGVMGLQFVNAQPRQPPKYCLSHRESLATKTGSGWRLGGNPMCIPRCQVAQQLDRCRVQNPEPVHSAAKCWCTVVLLGTGRERPPRHKGDSRGALELSSPGRQQQGKPLRCCDGRPILCSRDCWCHAPLHP